MQFCFSGCSMTHLSHLFQLGAKICVGPIPIQRPACPTLVQDLAKILIAVELFHILSHYSHYIQCLLNELVKHFEKRKVKSILSIYFFKQPYMRINKEIKKGGYVYFQIQCIRGHQRESMGFI